MLKLNTETEHSSTAQMISVLTNHWAGLLPVTARVGVSLIIIYLANLWGGGQNCDTLLINKNQKCVQVNN